MSYSVEEFQGCKIVTGSVPVTEMVAIMNSYGDEGMLDCSLSKIYGASMVVGTESSIEALRNHPRTLEAAHRKAMEEAGSIPLSIHASRWLEQGERGLSSETMFTRFTGIQLDGDKDHPHDGDDFRRCRLLLEAVPEFQAKLHLMKDVSPEWNNLIGAWQELCDIMDEEAPAWRNREGVTRKVNMKMAEFLA